MRKFLIWWLYFLLECTLFACACVSFIVRHRPAEAAFCIGMSLWFKLSR